MIEHFKRVDEAILDQLCLHLRRQPLIKIKLLNNHIMISAEGQHEASMHLLDELLRQLVRLHLVLNPKNAPFLSLLQTIPEQVLIIGLLDSEDRFENHDEVSLQNGGNDF